MRIRTIIAFLVALVILATVAGGYLYYRVSRNSLLREAHANADLQTKTVADHIGSHLSEFQKGVGVLAGMTDMRQALTRKDSESLLKANSVLDTFNKGLGVSVCYLMDADGNTLASSNRNTPKSFVGKNYAFRPYFQKALQGIPATYMALGVTSGKQGVYFSHPVYGPDKTLPLGVIVIKASTKALEHEIDQPWEGIMLLTDPNGVIFLSNRKDWQYKVLWEVSAQTISKIVRTRQFGQSSLNWVGVKRKNEHLATDLSGKEFNIHQSGFSNYKGWQTVFLHDHQAVFKRVGQPLFRTMGAVILTALLFIELALFALYRSAIRRIRQEAKAEQILQESEKKLRILFESSKDAIVITKKDGTITDVNQSALTMFGYGKNELERLNFSQVYVDPRDGKRFINAIGQHKSVSDFEVKLCKKDGTQIVCLMTVSARYAENKKIVTYQGIIRDVTEVRRNQEALQESEKKYRLLYQNAQEGILIAQNGMLKFPNPQALKLYDWPEEVLTTKPMTTFIHEEDRQMVQERHQARLRGEKPPDTYPFRIVTQAGEVKWVELRVAPLTWGDKPATLCFLTDITTRRQAEEEREKLIVDLRKALAEVKTLHGLLPVCANCKKIRDDGGYWNRIETYIEDHSEAEFSHSICPECERELYPELFEEEE